MMEDVWRIKPFEKEYFRTYCLFVLMQYKLVYYQSKSNKNFLVPCFRFSNEAKLGWQIIDDLQIQ